MGGGEPRPFARGGGPARREGAEAAAPVQQEVEADETTVLDFEQEHGWPTFAGMMKRAEAEAIKLGSPFYGCRDHKLLCNLVYLAAQGRG